MRSKKAMMFITVSLFLSILLFAGCSDEAKVEGQKLLKITVSEPNRGELWAPAHVAKTLGYYEDEGLDVEIVTLTGGANVTAVLTGDAEFGLYGIEGILKLNEMDQHTKLLLTTLQSFPYVFIGAPEYKSIGDLKGKNVCVTSGTGSPAMFTRAALRNGGLDPEKDVYSVTMVASATVAAMENDDIQGTYSYGVLKHQLLENGNNLLVNMYDPQVHMEVIGSPTYHTHIVFATDEYIEENPETVQKFVNAIYRGILWVNDHSVEEIAETLQPLFPERGEGALVLSIQEFKELGIFTETGEFTESGLEAANRMAIDVGLISKPISAEKAIDDTFLKKAQAQYE